LGIVHGKSDSNKRQNSVRLLFIIFFRYSDNEYRKGDNMPQNDWIWLQAPSLTHLSEAMHFRQHNLAAKESFAPHQHPWGQLVYASQGCLLLTVESNRYLLNHKQAVWIPANQMHYSGSITGAAFRSFYISQDKATQQCLPEQTTLYTVSPFFRHLVEELDRSQQQPEHPDYVGQIMSLLSAQLTRLKTVDCFLPWPDAEPLKTLCQHIYQNPDHERSLNDWAQHFNMSSRSVMRLFNKQMGMPYRTWKQKLTIFLAMQALANEQNITQIALDLGYANASAFIYRFRQEVGISPQKWREEKKTQHGS
jgi:AraC-like DNA-binding protein